MELINKLLDAQAKVGKKAALVQPAKKVEAEEKKGEAHNLQEESKGPKPKRRKPTQAAFEQAKKVAVADDSWHPAVDQMWRGVPGHSIVSENRMAMVLWQTTVKQELEAARRSGFVPAYLRAIYNQRFPPTLDEVQRRCAICWQVFSQTCHVQRHMDSFHGKKKERMRGYFRQETKELCVARTTWWQCIICGAKASNGRKVAEHMTATHSRLQLMKFNVHWICEWYDAFEPWTEICPRTKKRVTMLQLAEHSSQCKRCSVVTAVMGLLLWIGEHFDDWDEKDKCLVKIREATEVLHGLERLTKSAKWYSLH